MRAQTFFGILMLLSLQSTATMPGQGSTMPALPSPERPPPSDAATGSPSPVWLNIDCQTLTGDSFVFNTRVLGFDPRDNMDRPVDMELNGQKQKAEVFMSWIDRQTARLYMEIVLSEFQTRTSDRVLTLTASWMGDSGDPVFATGVMTDAVLDHQTGLSKGPPEQKVSCQIEGYKFRMSRPGPF